MLFRFKYPKFAIFFLSVIIAVLIFRNRETLPFHTLILSLGTLGVFVCGSLYSYGFLAAPSTALLLMFAEQYNPWIIALVGGIGALISDVFILQVIRHSFADEIEKLRHEPLIIAASGKVPAGINRLFVPVIGCLIIASPFPDEIGIAMLATTRIPPQIFLVLSFLLNGFGILMIAFIGRTF
ncbi:MAG: hypothetical protein V1735_04110 [Nanoarchaeota archaeon]